MLGKFISFFLWTLGLYVILVSKIFNPKNVLSKKFDCLFCLLKVGLLDVRSRFFSKVGKNPKLVNKEKEEELRRFYSKKEGRFEEEE